jgi:predicted benzoate:H+ symporter BenE
VGASERTLKATKRTPSIREWATPGVGDLGLQVFHGCLPGSAGVLLTSNLWLRLQGSQRAVVDLLRQVGHFLIDLRLG